MGEVLIVKVVKGVAAAKINAILGSEKKIEEKKENELVKNNEGIKVVEINERRYMGKKVMF